MRDDKGWRLRDADDEGWRGPGPRHVHEHWGPPPFRRGKARVGPGPFGGFGPMGRIFADDPRFGRGPRVRRGDVRAAALALLAEEPLNGYQIIQEIRERSDGLWRPSPGSVYPALAQLEDEGLIRAETGEGGRRAYVLTDAGREYVDAHPEELRAPWDVVARTVGGSQIETRKLIGQLAMAAMQVVSAGSDSQVAEARRVLTEARRRLYRILAADDEDGDDGDGEAGGPGEGAGQDG